MAIVALPLALGFGVSSGLGAEAGLATAVVAGALAALFGGSNLQASGPTGADSVGVLDLLRLEGREYATTPEAVHGASGRLERAGVFPAARKSARNVTEMREEAPR